MTTVADIQILHSIIAPAALKTLLQENYDIEQILDLQILSIGDNDNYVVTTVDKKYVLKIYKRNKYWLKNKSDYLFEGELL